NASAGSLSFTLDTAAPVVTASAVTTLALALPAGSPTAAPSIAGTADANATVRFTVDGSAVTGTATADAGGAWSFSPTGLADGTHTIVASETNAGGATGSAALTFTLDTKTPVITEALAGGGTTTTTGALVGTADPNAVVRFTVDGVPIAATATADANGN